MFVAVFSVHIKKYFYKLANQFRFWQFYPAYLVFVPYPFALVSETLCFAQE